MASVAVILAADFAGDLDALESALGDAVEDASVGQIVADSAGDDGINIHFDGPNADQLWDALSPVLAMASLGPGCFAVKFYDEPERAHVTIALPEARL